MYFSEDEIRRYARHLVLADVGGPGQQKLKDARLLVIGAGGLGAPVLSYTAAAGVGQIGVVDHDTVSVSDLQRQVIYATDDVGRPKVQSAKAALGKLNPHVEVEPYCVQLTAANAVSLVSGYDIVADCTDNAETRYLISDACFHAGKTLVTGAVGQFDGSLTVLKPHLKGTDGNPNPTYRCLFPRLPDEGAAPRCAEVGVLGVLTGLVGSLQALEIVKEIVGIGSNLVGQLLMIDSRALRFDQPFQAGRVAVDREGFTTRLDMHIEPVLGDIDPCHGGVHHHPSLPNRASLAAQATVRVRWNGEWRPLLKDGLASPRGVRSATRHRAHQINR